MLIPRPCLLLVQTWTFIYFKLLLGVDEWTFVCSHIVLYTVDNTVCILILKRCVMFRGRFSAGNVQSCAWRRSHASSYYSQGYFLVFETNRANLMVILSAETGAVANEKSGVCHTWADKVCLPLLKYYVRPLQCLIIMFLTCVWIQLTFRVTGRWHMRAVLPLLQNMPTRGETYRDPLPYKETIGTR